MAESSEVQALEKISNEVGESQVKITLSSQCIKAQAFLVDKLKKQTERQREICGFISSSNLKLQTEIKQAELEIKSLITAHETIKSSNVELKKELLLAKERKIEIEERITNGEKKYEDLWLQSKERYESIPFVQKLLAVSSKTQIIKDNIAALENQSETLAKEYKVKKEFLVKLDRERIIKLAEYLVHDLPGSVKILQEKSMAIHKMSSEIEGILKDQETALSKPAITLPTKETFEQIKGDKPIDDGWVNIYQNNVRDFLMMPRLQSITSDFGDLSAKLDEIKIKKTEVQNSASNKRLDAIESVSEISNKRTKKDDGYSMFFNDHALYGTADDKKSSNFSKKKLINILEDVKLDQSDTYNIVSKIQINTLKGVDTIGMDKKDDEENEPETTKEKDTEVIEEIDLTKTKSDGNILIPPTQFLDLTQEKIFSSSSQQQVEVIVHMSMPTEPSTENLSHSLKNSQEAANKKRVSFDLPLSIQEMQNKMCENDLNEKQIEENDVNETIDSQGNISLTSDESYTKIKDMIMKKHNLDLSPQFVYAKNKLLQMDNAERIVTSKFFQGTKSNVFENEGNKITDVSDIASKECDDEENCKETEKNTVEAIESAMDADDIIVSSPKPKQTAKERTVTGLLFNHGTQGIPDSLNVSISTTGFEEGDADFPHCIDSSLLLSPKADLPMSMAGDGVDVASQEVPNFLSGLRKTGLSFFGQSATEARPGTSGQTHGNNFNFNFGGDDKKARGGLFSMFR